jgi:hypothetical protein
MVPGPEPLPPTYEQRWQAYQRVTGPIPTKVQTTDLSDSKSVAPKVAVASL